MRQHLDTLPDALGTALAPGDHIAIARVAGSRRVYMIRGVVTSFGPAKRIYFQPQDQGNAAESWTRPDRTILIQQGATSE